MATVLDRIKKLMALTTSPFEEEARTAAVTAVRLIVEHNLLVKSMPRRVVKHEEDEEGVDATISDIFRRAREKKPGPAPRQGMAALKQCAFDKCDRFVSFLEKKSELGEYPVFSAVRIADKAVKDGQVNALDRAKFHYYLQMALRLQVVSGVLRSVKGYGGGYRLGELRQARRRRKAS